MFRRLFAAGLAILATGLTSSADAQYSGVNRDDRWVLIGTREVDFGKDVDTVDVTKAQGRFKALRLVNKRSDIVINNVEIRYGNGQVHNESRTINLNEGERTRPLDLKGEERFLDSVTMSYRTRPGYGQRGIIEVYGLQAPGAASFARPGPGSGPPVVSRPSGPPPYTGPGPGPGPGPAATQPPGVTGPVAGTATSPAPAAVRPGQQTDSGDVLFGTQSVGFGVDRDIIRVGTEVGKFDRIRMRVLDNDIFINSMKVVYANGEAEEVAYNADVRKDTRTRWIQLKGDRFIKEIQLTYRSRPSVKGQAYIEVYGQYAEGWLGPQGEGKKYNAGWVMLGAQTAGFTIDRNDVINISRNEGGFRKVRVQVRDQAITMFELRVVYGNGEVDVIPFNRQRIDAGARSAEIDLKGGARIISEIRPTYRTRIFQQGGVAKGRAVVEFWGVH
jgi:hypothetical protein